MNMRTTISCGLMSTGTPFAYVQQDAIFMKPGDFKWWLFLDTWVR